jgi:hypothetical protein
VQLLAAMACPSRIAVVVLPSSGTLLVSMIDLIGLSTA